MQEKGRLVEGGKHCGVNPQAQEEHRVNPQPQEEHRTNKKNDRKH